VLHNTEAGWRVLLLRVYGYWDFPKGRVEPGESALATAKRETREETGLDDLDFAWGDVYMDSAPYGRGKKVARYFVARTASPEVFLPVNPELGRPEHHEWRWCDWETAARLLPERLQPIARWARDRID
jgi:8-oxo-dGTP pyrophosphatase MutT (NUDIX family)